MNKSMNKAKEIKLLIQKLNNYRDAYYNNNQSIISDKEYDELFDKLVLMEEETGYIFSNSPTQSVGYKSVSQLQKVKHSHPLLSLAKTTDLQEFISYFGNEQFLLMAKLDGLTCSLTYIDGKLVRAESRGNGEIGEDITHNAKVFSNLPTKIPFKGKLEVDGECIITYDEFDKINQRENTEYKNPRNLVSGSVRQLNSEIVANRNIKFIAWKLNMAENMIFENHSDGFLFLSELGFDIVPYFSNSFDTISWIVSECKAEKIPIDGVVGIFDDIEYGNSLGSTGHHPKHSFAFKFYQEENKTILKDIEWATSRTGLVTPVAIFEPIEIDGTTVSRASLSNASIIKELELGIGDAISVIKSNQIIPKITKNYTRSKTYKLPEVCPECGKPVIIKNDNGREMLYCTNKYCKAILHDKIANFVSREAMNIIGISDERLKMLMDMGYITDFTSIYNIKKYKKEISELKGFGQSSIENIINSIENSRHCKLSNVIVAIGIPGIGKSVAKVISEYIESLQENDLLGKFLEIASSGFDWRVLDDIGDTLSDNINLYIKENYDKIYPLTNILSIEKSKVKQLNQELKGITFCITGKLFAFNNRKKLVEDIESKGGVVVPSVTAKTQYLITNDKNTGSSKNKSAKKYGTKVINETEYQNLLK